MCLSKLACLPKPEDTSLLRNLSISCKLRVRNVLVQAPGEETLICSTLFGSSSDSQILDLPEKPTRE
jgi:hypothetical protein